MHPRCLTPFAATLAMLLLLLACAGIVAASAAPGDSKSTLQPIESASDAGTVDGRLSLSPVRFDPVDIDPGSAAQFELVVRNQSDAPVRLAVAAYDLTGSADPKRYAQLAEAGSGDAAAWVTFPGFDGPRTLAPGRQLRVPVVVDVPADASPGTHAVGFGVTQGIAAPGISTDDAARVRLDAGAVSVAVVDVAGAASPQLRVRSVDAPRVIRGGRATDIRVEVENTGNTRLAIDGEVRLAALLQDSGTTLPDGGPVGGEATLPGGRRTLTMHWSDPPLIGRYAPTVVVVGGEGSGIRITRDLEPIYVVPPWWIIALLVAAIALPVRTVRRRRRRGHRVPRGPRH